MKRLIGAICGLCLVTMTTGCNIVTITNPLGDADPSAYKMLEGTWADEHGNIVVARVSDLGQLFAGFVEWDEPKDEFKVETLNVRVTKAGKLRFLQAKSDPQSRDGRVAFSRFEADGGKAVRIYAPVVSVFEDAVNSKKLKGTVRKQRFQTDIRLEEPTEAVLAFIEKMGSGTCFEKEPSLTLKQLGRRE